jgi:hypothetical protein
MPLFELPTVEDVFGFGSEHNPAVWAKHRQRLSNSADLEAVSQKCQTPNRKVSQRQVFEMANAKPEWGVIASIVWGFPRGSMPGGTWLGFANAFESSSQFADTIAGFRGNASSGNA